jgi:hypothetical protein
LREVTCLVTTRSKVYPKKFEKNLKLSKSAG